MTFLCETPFDIQHVCVMLETGFLSSPAFFYHPPPPFVDEEYLIKIKGSGGAVKGLGLRF